MRGTIAAYYSQKQADDLSDGRVWRLWLALRGNTDVGEICSYVGSIFKKTPELDTLLSKYVEPDEVAV